MKYRLIHQQLTLALEQSAKQKAVLRFALRGQALETVVCRIRHFFQVIWIVPIKNPLLNLQLCKSPMDIFSTAASFLKPAIAGICIAIGLSLAIPANAAPANPFPKAFTQPDGTAIQVYSKGDEFLKWSEDAEGNLMVFDAARKAYCYAEWTDGGPLSTGEAVGRQVSESPGRARAKGSDIPPSLLAAACNKHEERNAWLTQSRKTMIGGMKSKGWDFSPSSSPQLAPIPMLKRTVLVIHATWEDRAGIGTPKLNGHDIFGYVFDPATRSANNYFKELFGSSEDIILPAKVDNPLDGRQGVIEVAFSGRFPGESMETLNMPIIAAASRGLINFSDFDTNKDGILDSAELSVAIIFDTREFLGGAWWPNLNKSLTGNVAIPTVCGQGAFDGKSGDKESDMITIGMFCHEFGHSSYFFFDTYDYTYQSQGHGWWSLMAAGMWAYKDNENAGASPGYLDASNLVGASRLGNMGEHGLLSPGTVSSSQGGFTANSHLDVYRVNSPIADKQYFLLQQRKWGENDNFDRGVFYQLAPASPPFQTGPKPGAGGLLICHEDESVPGPYYFNNKRTHYRTGIEEAHGGAQHLQINARQGEVGDQWGNAKKHFSHASDPPSTLYSAFTSGQVPPTQAIDSGISIYNIEWDPDTGKTSFDVGIAQRSSDIAIINSPPALFTLETWAFQAALTDPEGGVAWAASGGGSINAATGLYTAPGSAATATVTAASLLKSSVRHSVEVRIRPSNMTNFDGNSPDTPSLLGLANAYGTDDPAGLAKYDLTGDGKIDDEDIRMLFRGMGWQ
jgi:M6 family metalloprotease-like protein